MSSEISLTLICACFTITPMAHLVDHADRSSEVRVHARSLRQHGWTYTEICRKLGMIPKATLANWFQDIASSPEQQNRIQAKILRSAAQGRPLARQMLAEKLEQWKTDKRRRADDFIDSLALTSAMTKLACALLYLAEGQKYPASRFLGFSNTNPGIIRLFLQLLRASFPINESRFRCRISRRCDQDYEPLKAYWSSVTGIPTSRFFQSKADPRTQGKPTRRENYRGVCAVYYTDVNIQ